MKRIWIGIGLLIVLLLGEIGIAGTMEQIHDPGAVDLRRAGELVLEADWPQAEALARCAEERWKNAWHFTASVSDHEPMDEIDALFAQLAVHAQAQDAPSYAAVCGELSARLNAMSQAQTFSWWNLL